MTFKSIENITSILVCSVFVICFSCSSSDESSNNSPNDPIQTFPDINPDLNNDGELNILILGTSSSIDNNAGAFAADQISTELNNILTQDTNLDLEYHTVFEDIYRSAEITFGLGQAGSTFNGVHFSHSLMQYYFWPDGQSERLANLAGEGDHQWDYVIIVADPYIISKLPGYFALGVNKILTKITEGDAKALLLLQWPKNEGYAASIEHFEEFTYRTADNAIAELEVIPAGLAWNALPSEKQDSATEHPSPNGAYLAAASIYSQILERSAKVSDYEYDNDIADIALATKTNEENNTHYTGERTFISPYKACDIDDDILNYNHTGTSSENGILSGLNWVITRSDRSLVNEGTPPINFNYGRANTNFEPQKRYNIDPTQFDFSIGFPMQDNGNHGDLSMLYGIDKRYDDANNGTDLGTALYMVRNSELPNGRAVPVRTLYALLKEAIPTQSAYSDNWHMHGDLNRAIGAFMYTMLTGDCVLIEEPTDQNSSQWKKWKSYRIGYETAYTIMTSTGAPPPCN